MLKSALSIASLVVFPGLLGVAHAQRIPYAQDEIVPPTAEWSARVKGAAPERATVSAERRKLLVFSHLTGYDHKVIPHVNRVLEILGDKTGAFETTVTVDIEDLEPESLARYDVLALNNNCSVGPRRNLFLDELESNPRYAALTAEQREARSDALEQSLLDFVAAGKGLVVLHGAPTLLNNSAQFTGMVGGAFDYHPPNQEVTLRPVDEDHPLLAAFRGKGPFIHRDEPYCFKGTYEKLDFRPLLSMDVGGIEDPKGEVGDQVRYVAWVRPHGQGRVFFCSPSHFPESYASATILLFLLDGIQYAAGDLKCDDSAPPAEGSSRPADDSSS
jgi:type 1 glutamine amidotransferase